MAGIYFPVINTPRTSAPPRMLGWRLRGVAGFGAYVASPAYQGSNGVGTYVASPAYQGSNGLGADAPATVTDATTAAIQSAIQIGVNAANQRLGLPTTSGSLTPAPGAKPAASPSWMPWAIGGGAVLLLGGAFVAFRARRK